MLNSSDCERVQFFWNPLGFILATKKIESTQWILANEWGSRKILNISGRYFSKCLKFTPQLQLRFSASFVSGGCWRCVWGGGDFSSSTSSHRIRLFAKMLFFHTCCPCPPSFRTGNFLASLPASLVHSIYTISGLRLTCDMSQITVWRR